MNIVFVAPFPAETTLRFVRAAKALGRGRLLGVVHTPPGGADAKLFDDVARVENPMDVGELAGAVHAHARRSRFDPEGRGHLGRRQTLHVP